MNRSGRSLGIVVGAVLGASLSSLPGRAQNVSTEQQIRSHYRIASVGNNGVVVRPGSVVVVQMDGIRAIPVEAGIYWSNSYKKGSRIKQSFLFEVNYVKIKDQTRLLQVGERAHITGIQFTGSDVIFRLQTSPADANEPPFRAALSFQLSKGYLGSMSAAQIQDIIGEILALDAGDPAPPVTQNRPPDPGRPAFFTPTPMAQPAEQLNLPATYVSAQNQTDQLQLNADSSFMLQQGGQAYTGTFTANGSSLVLTIRGTNTSTTATVQGNNLTDGNGQTWILREQPAQSAALEGVLQNQDILKMVKTGFPDTVIIAKMSISKCQFDTSPDALIQLKESGVSADVLKAMLKKQ